MNDLLKKDYHEMSIRIADENWVTYRDGLIDQLQRIAIPTDGAVRVVADAVRVTSDWAIERSRSIAMLQVLNCLESEKE
jgi:hypothetical protein